MKAGRNAIYSAARLLSLVAAMATVLIPGISNATIWNDATDFSLLGNPNGPWSYGNGATGTSFSPYTVSSTACNLPNPVSGISCWQPTATMFGVPVVGMNTTASTINFGTVVLPTGLLLVHPGVSTASNPNDSIVQWTAPAAGTYSISGFFEVLDTMPNHRIFWGIYDNSTLERSGSLFTPGATGFPTNIPGQNDSFCDPFCLTLSLTLAT